LLASDFPIAIGQDGHLYYPRRRSGTSPQLVKLQPDGQSSVLVSLPAETAGKPLRYLNGLAASPDGSLLYTEDDAIRRVSKEGGVSTVLTIASCESLTGSGAKGNPQLQGMVVNGSGTIYVAATGCRAVLQVTPAGKATVLPQVPSRWAPTGVTLLGNDVYAVEFQESETEDRRAMVPRVRKITPDGKTTIVATVAR
jgi:sugar lactone lactonase YvrE